MSDRYPYYLAIGGDVSRSLADNLTIKLRDCDMWPEAMDPNAVHAKPMTVQQMIDATDAITLPDFTAPVDCLYVKDYEASPLDVEALCTWLKGRKIPFVCEAAPFYETGGSTRWCVGDVDFTRDTLDGMEPYVKMSALRQVEAMLEGGDVYGALATLKKACPTLPQLPPFRVVDPPRRKKRKP